MLSNLDALKKAIETGDVEAIQKLLSSNADVKSEPDNTIAIQTEPKKSLDKLDKLKPVLAQDEPIKASNVESKREIEPKPPRTLDSLDKLKPVLAQDEPIKASNVESKVEFYTQLFSAIIEAGYDSSSYETTNNKFIASLSRGSKEPVNYFIKMNEILSGYINYELEKPYFQIIIPLPKFAMNLSDQKKIEIFNVKARKMLLPSVLIEENGDMRITHKVFLPTSVAGVIDCLSWIISATTDLITAIYKTSKTA